MFFCWQFCLRVGSSVSADFNTLNINCAISAHAVGELTHRILGSSFLVLRSEPSLHQKKIGMNSFYPPLRYPLKCVSVLIWAPASPPPQLFSFNMIKSELSLVMLWREYRLMPFFLIILKHLIMCLWTAAVFRHSRQSVISRGTFNFNSGGKKGKKTASCSVVCQVLCRLTQW